MEDLKQELAGFSSVFPLDEIETMELLWPVAYEELHRIAHRQLMRCRPGKTLNTTALVHEAYLKLVSSRGEKAQDRRHLLGLAAVAMRHILVDYARQRMAKKRGGAERLLEFDENLFQIDVRAGEILVIHQALEALTDLDGRLGLLVQLRFFGGLTIEETSSVMGISERTVKRDWRKARAFLYQALQSDTSGED